MGSFDRVDHEALIGKLATYPAMETAIRRILSAGVLVGEVLTASETGTPQGGPLSPLLANIVLTGLEEALTSEFPPTRIVSGTRVTKAPRFIAYADDFLVLGSSLEVVVECQRYIDAWLQPMGLNLSPSKTRITHTLEPPAPGTAPGFDFLGCHIRQYRVGKHQAKPYFNGVYTWIGPSKVSTKRLYATCTEIIDSSRPQKKHNAAYQHQLAKGRASREEVLIHRLNPVLRGWGNYHSPLNSKEAFGRIDHQLWKKLFRHLKKTHPRLSTRQVVDTFFNCGHPWSFKIQPAGPRTKPTELLKLASIPIRRHFPVQGIRSYYDGDWAYWGKRQGRYPTIPKALGSCLKRQNGLCACCKTPFTRTDIAFVVKSRKGPSSQWRAVHRTCVDPSRDATAPLIQRDRGEVASSPVR
ncbi:hypothetical protein BH23VER1_BH23VER1_32700 [soil metagenome]